jgi:hypothetical protein
VNVNILIKVFCRKENLSIEKISFHANIIGKASYGKAVYLAHKPIDLHPKKEFN